MPGPSEESKLSRPVALGQQRGLCHTCEVRVHAWAVKLNSISSRASDTTAPPSTKTPSFSEDAKAISGFMDEKLKPLGFKKRRNGFNKRFENGLTHQISIFSVGAYSIDHGKFYTHAGCYIPEAELYRKNVTEPKWITDALCTVRGHFPHGYFSLNKVATNLDAITPYLDNALDALASVDSYDGITGNTLVADPASPTKSLRFETPQPIVQACIQFARMDVEGASKTIRQYITAKKADEEPHFRHIEAVAEWAEELGLQ